MKGYRQKKQDINQVLKAPKYRKLKNAALIAIAIVIALQLAMIIWLKHIPYKTLLFLRGCVGIGALLFVILVAILVYKAYSDYFNNKYNKG